MGDFGGFSSGGINVNDIFQMFGGGGKYKFYHCFIIFIGGFSSFGGDDMGGMGGGFPGFGGFSSGGSSGRSKKSRGGNQTFTFKFG